MQSEKKQKQEYGIGSVILIAFVGCLIYALNICGFPGADRECNGSAHRNSSKRAKNKGGHL